MARSQTGSPGLSGKAWVGWLPLLLLPIVTAIAVPPSWPRWALMWLLALAIYAAVKWLTWWSVPFRNASFQLQVAYFLAWPGLDARAFLRADESSTSKPAKSEWYFASAKLLLGLVVLYGASAFLPKDQVYLLGWAGMIGIVLALHFGGFHLLSCYWRSHGVDARPLMQWPLASTSVAEFWGRRWNTAFRDLAHRFLFRPLSRRWGTLGGLLLGFLFSGLVHDAVISFPAGSGYGGPTLYFCLQAAGLLLERWLRERMPLFRSGWIDWAYTMLVVAAPAGLLFHSPFVLNIVVPFMAAIGAA